MIFKRIFQSNLAQKKLLSFVFVIFLTFLTGCGQKEGENIKVGFAAIEQSDYTTAMQCFETAVDAGEDAQLAYRGIGMTYLGMAKYEESIEAFETALSNGGLFAGDLERDINFYMATALYKNGQYTNSGELLDIIIESEKDNVDAHFLRGCIALETGDYENGIYHFDKAIEYSKDQQSIKICVFEELASNGYDEKGSEYLTGILDDSTKLSDYEQGVVYFYLKDYDSARNHLGLAKQAGGKNMSSIVYMLGKTYEQLGEYNYASVLYTEYLQDNIGDANIYNQLGICQLELGDTASAIQSFESGLSLGDPSMTQTLKYNQICAYEQATNFTKAKALLDEYLIAYPDDENARREAVFLSTR